MTWVHYHTWKTRCAFCLLVYAAFVYLNYDVLSSLYAFVAFDT